MFRDLGGEVLPTSLQLLPATAYFLRSLVVKLKAIFGQIGDLRNNSPSDVKNSLRQFFYELCEEQPGVVPVRQSFGPFKAMIALDDQNRTALFDGGHVDREAQEEAAPEEV
jgi:hypothetical protein